MALCAAAASAASASNDFFNLGFFGNLRSLGHRNLLLAVSGHGRAQVLDVLLFLGHGLFNRDTLADHIGDVLLLDLEGFFFLDAASSEARSRLMTSS